MTSESLVTPESVTDALGTMPEQRQAIAEGSATAETYDVVALRVAVFQARAKGCVALPVVGDEWDALQDHVMACRVCRPKNPRKFRQRVEYLAPGLVGVPDDDDRRLAVGFQPSARSVPDLVAAPLKKVVELVSRVNPALVDPTVVKAALGVVGVVVMLVGLAGSQSVPPPGELVVGAPSADPPADPAADPSADPSGSPPDSTPPVAGPSVSPVTAASGVAPGTTPAGTAGTTGTTTTGRQGQSISDRQQGVTSKRGWAYVTTPSGQYDQPVGQQVELNRQWQWGTWRREGVDRYITLVRRGEGAYEVRLPALAGADGTAHAGISNGWGYPQAFSCQTSGTRPDGDDLLVDVACFTPAGVRKNLPFALVFTTDAPAVRYRGGAPGATRTGPGQYEVTSLRGNGFALVSPVGQSQARCRSTVEPQRVRVACDADTDWNLTYTEGAAIHQDPSASAAYLTTGRNSWSSNGETPAVTRTGLGQYEVQYQSIGNPKTYPADVVQVSASGPQPRYCRVWAWNGYSFPPKVLVQVRCYDQAGAPADSEFALAYVRSP
ncbi:hypothetical protein [Lentzea sp. NPDC055074]